MTSPPAPLENRPRRGEWFAAAAAGMAILTLHLVFFISAGGLWRDEAGYVRLATSDSWSEVWGGLFHDHSPILMPAVIRLWCGIAGDSDFNLRLLGLGVGLFILAGFFMEAWIMRGGIPWVALVLMGTNVAAIRAGDSLRAYGLGSAFNVLALAFIFRAAVKPDFKNTGMAVLAAVLSVQSLYQNLVFVMASCCGGILLCLWEKRRRDIFWMLAIGAVATLTLLPYSRPMVESQSWWVLEKAGFDFSTGGQRLFQILESPWTAAGWFWVAIFLSSIFILFNCLKRPVPEKVRRVVIFSGAGLLTGIAGFFAFLKVSALPTQPWYYLPLLAFAGACLDAIVLEYGGWKWKWSSATGAAFAVLISLAGCWGGLPQAEYRQTNMDLIAARLSKEAGGKDCVIIYPWYCGVSFNRYYHGAARWTTIPPLEDYGIHRYDQLKARLQETDPSAPVIQAIGDALRSGNRVWVVGWLATHGGPPPAINPAPRNPWGWLEEPYCNTWSKQAGYFIAHHATQIEANEPKELSVNPFENLPVYIFSGWENTAK